MSCFLTACWPTFPKGDSAGTNQPCVFPWPQVIPSIGTTTLNGMDVCTTPSHPSVCFQLLQFPRIQGHFPVHVHKGKGVAPNSPSARTLQERRTALQCVLGCGVGFAAVCSPSRLKNKCVTGKHRQKRAYTSAAGLIMGVLTKS